MALERASRSRASERVALSQPAAALSRRQRHGLADALVRLQQQAGNAAVARFVTTLKRQQAAAILPDLPATPVARAGGRQLLRSAEVAGGKFIEDPYVAVKTPTAAGAKMGLKFQPSVFKLKKLVPFESRLELHLVQIVRELRGNSATATTGATTTQGNVGFDERKVASGTYEGWGIDVDWQAGSDEGYLKIANARHESLAKTIKDLEAKGQLTEGEQRQLDAFKWQLEIDNLKLNKQSGKAGRGKVTTSLDPRYAQQRVSADLPLYTVEGPESAGNAAVKEAGEKTAFNPPYAALRDAPSVPLGEPLLGMEFEVAALVDYGPPESPMSRYVGSVRWGWRRSAGKNDVTLTPLSVVVADGVSDTFKAAAQHWNQLNVADPGALRQGPRQVMQLPAQ